MAEHHCEVAESETRRTTVESDKENRAVMQASTNNNSSINSSCQTKDSNVTHEQFSYLILPPQDSSNGLNVSMETTSSDHKCTNVANEYTDSQYKIFYNVLEVNECVREFQEQTRNKYCMDCCSATFGDEGNFDS